MRVRAIGRSKKRLRANTNTVSDYVASRQQWIQAAQALLFPPARGSKYERQRARGDAKIDSAILMLPVVLEMRTRRLAGSDENKTPKLPVVLEMRTRRLAGSDVPYPEQMKIGRAHV